MCADGSDGKITFGGWRRVRTEAGWFSAPPLLIFRSARRICRQSARERARSARPRATPRVGA
eukprot:5291491-Pyramimonas_sp.AAC.1